MELMAERISRIRRAIRPRLTQAEAALRVGVSRETWGQWERGGTENPQQKHLFKIAAVLKTTVSYLLYGSDDNDQDRLLSETFNIPLSLGAEGPSLARFVQSQTSNDVELDEAAPQGDNVIVKIKMNAITAIRLLRMTAITGKSLDQLLKQMLDNEGIIYEACTEQKPEW